MKTSELRQGIRNLGFDFKETDEYILVSEVIRIFKRAQRFSVIGSGIYGYYGKIMLLKLAIEYTETPIEEREEEKKYKIYFEEQVLVKKYDGNFCFLWELWEFGSTVLQITFTQLEIDDLPRLIKDAIKCGFLKKVEIES